MKFFICFLIALAFYGSIALAFYGGIGYHGDKNIPDENRATVAAELLVAGMWPLMVGYYLGYEFASWTVEITDET